MMRPGADGGTDPQSCNLGLKEWFEMLRSECLTIRDYLGILGILLNKLIKAFTCQYYTAFLIKLKIKCLNLIIPIEFLLPYFWRYVSWAINFHDVMTG